jgi:hypothetical protein
MEKQEIIRKLKSLLLNLQVHPENEPNSEFADRITDLHEIIKDLEKEWPEASKPKPTDPVKERITALVDSLAWDTDQDGSLRFDVCDHFNWNRFNWNHRHVIMSRLREKGYIVNPVTRHGVLEIHISKR